jgi:pimeloyl-ACP methyl ester carboxylesterase
MSQESKVEVGGHLLRVRTTGSGELTFVCLHGFADSLEVWNEVATALEKRGRVIAFDLPAHGDSGAAEGACHWDDLAAELITLLDRLGLGRVVLVGHELGALSAIAVALRAPERVAGLALIGAASHLSERAAQRYADAARAGEVNALDGIVRAMHGPTTTRKIEGNAPGLVQIARLLSTLHDAPLTPRLGELRCPTLLLVGDHDPMGPGIPAAMKRQLGSAALEVVRGRGNRLHVEDPTATVAAIERFVAATQSGRA